MIDAHAHLSASSMAPLVDDVVTQLRVMGIRHIVLGGIDPADWWRQLDLAHRYPGFLTTSAGIHPWVVRDCENGDLESMFHHLKERAADFDLMGEVGFDFHEDNSLSQKTKQMHWCERQLDLASSLLKPVVLHVVRGHDQTLTLLRGRKTLFGILHAFSGSPELAEQYSRLGFIISIGRRFFSSKYGKDLRWLKELPFVIESDGPLKTWPQSNPKIIAERWIQELRSSAQKLADGFGMSPDAVWALSAKNLNKIWPKTDL